MYLNEDDENIKSEFILTKEKLKELQSENLYHIKNIINNLVFYGKNVQLEKHRPNKERYPVGNIQEPNIKILIENFITLLEKKGKRINNNLNNYNINSGKINSSLKIISQNIKREFISETSSSFSNLFNTKSIFYIKILCLFIIVMIITFIILEFIFTFIHLSDIKARIEYLEYGYQLLSNMLYIKYFISEAIFSSEIPEKFPKNEDISYYYNNKERIKYIEKLKKELGEYLILFNKLLNNFNSATINLSNEYLSFTRNVNMSIYTITISDIRERESINYENFSSAMRRISSDVFYISSNTNPNYVINMKNQNSFEIMQNILNTFYLTWKQIINILYKDIQSHCTKSKLSYILLVSSFLLTFIFLFLIYKLLLIFSNDREKPINVFLTIKKNIFEKLKNTSESFSNKLLNKFFDNEENEEIITQDYSINIKEDDINIIKFKSSSKHKLMGNKDKTNIIIFMKLTYFLIFCNLYIISKFFYTFNNIKHLSAFTEIFNTTYNTHINIILSIDVIKSFLFNDSIPIFNKNGKNGTLFQLLDIFYKQSNSFEEILLITSSSNYFLEYRNKFYEYLYHDYNDLVNKDINNISLIEKNNKFSPILNRLFENLKYITLKYLNYGYKEKREKYENNNFDGKNGYPSELIADKIWVEIDELTTIYIKYWFNSVFDLMLNYLNEYANKNKLIHVNICILLVIIIIFVYCIFWKNYENKLISILNRSFDLVNLIPKDIKNIIVSKLNE